jgi:hypothetical protein
LQRSEFRNAAYSEEQLIDAWGMTRSEAHDTSGNKSAYLAVFISDRQRTALAVFYADSQDNRFFDPVRLKTESVATAFKRFEEKVLEYSHAHGLIDSLSELERSRVRNKQIDVFEPRVA